MDKRFLAVVAIIIGVFAFFAFGSKDKSSSSTGGDSKSSVSNHVKGVGNKKVEFIEYADFQCPYCGQYYPVLQQVKEKYGDDIKFIFRNFPLESLHQNARAAHRAAEAASRQDKFWEMYDKLYQNQSEWSSVSVPQPIFEGYAKEIGLNIDTYKQDCASSAVNDTINADIEDGKQYKITGTPTFVVNGKAVELPDRTLQAFSQIIDKAIADASATTSPSATPTPETSVSPTPAQ